LFRVKERAPPLKQNAHISQLQSEKELIFKVLKSMPSKREAKSYIKKFSAASDSVHKITSQPVFPIALVNLIVPLYKEELEQVAQTLAYMQRLGLYPVVVLENTDWAGEVPRADRFEPGQFRYLKEIMINDGLALSELLEMENVKTRLISSDCLDATPSKVPGPVRIAHSNIDIKPIASSLKCGAIPIVLPICSSADSTHSATSSFDAMCALSKVLSRYTDQDTKIYGRRLDVMKVIVINNRGGIPNLGFHGQYIPFVNLKQDFDSLIEGYQINNVKLADPPTWQSDLNIVMQCLEYLPATTSAVVLSANTINAVIGNLITDKPLVSPSLPTAQDQNDVTVLRYGLKTMTHTSLKTVDQYKLWKLLNDSFGKEVDIPKFKARLDKVLHSVVIAGDYQGASIVTLEEGDTIYLDKFAVGPQHQGIGVADLLWKQLLTDYPDLMWRSRDVNPINKWYFERCDGNWKVPNSEWVMFWYGKTGVDRISQYLKVAGNIPPSFLPKKN
jgi:amino-acid N-acetyltransferase